MLIAKPYPKSRKSRTLAILLRRSRTIGLELKTLATRFISSVASVVVCSALTLSTTFASSDDLVFTTAVDPDSRRFKWDYKKDGAAVPVNCVAEGEEYVCTVQGGMTINVRNGASQWTDVRQWGNSTLGGQIFALGDDGGLGSLRTITATDAPTLATKINLLFSGQANFDGKGIENWETGSVTDMSQMFVDARNFDGDISNWDVSSVTNFTNMFTRARAFNQDISGWTVSGAVPETNDTCFDAGDTAANPNTCRKRGFGGMFYDAPAFNQDLSSWSVSAYFTTSGAVRAGQIACGAAVEGALAQEPVAAPFSDNPGWERCKQPGFDPAQCGVPGAPTNLQPTAANTEVHITFDEPDNDGGAVISDYQYTTDGGASTQSTGGDLTGSITITGLTNNTEYNIQVRAVNSQGASAWSTAVQSTPESGNAPPEPPTNLQLVSTVSGAVALSFTAGSDNGATITDYEASWDEVVGENSDAELLSSDGFVSLSATASPVTVNGLTDGRTYDITLRARNEEGPGGDSDPLRVLLPATSAEFPAGTGNDRVSLSLPEAKSCGIDQDELEFLSADRPDTIASTPVDAMRFALDCTQAGETVSLLLEFPETDITETARLFKIRGEDDWKEIVDAVFDYENDSVTYAITDDTTGDPDSDYDGLDLDPEPRRMSDPVAVAYLVDTDGDGVPDTEDACPTDPACSARPVPTLTWPVFLTLFSLVGWLGYRRLSTI